MGANYYFFFLAFRVGTYSKVGAYSNEYGNSPRGHESSVFYCIGLDSGTLDKIPLEELGGGRRRVK